MNDAPHSLARCIFCDADLLAPVVEHHILCSVIKELGSQAELARRIRVSPQAVTKWMKNGIPPKRVIGIESACNGVVTRYDLRPDLYPRDHAA